MMSSLQWCGGKGWGDDRTPIVIDDDVMMMVVVMVMMVVAVLLLRNLHWMWYSVQIFGSICWTGDVVGVLMDGSEVL